MSNATIRVATSLLLALCAALACTVQAQTPGSLDTTPFRGGAAGAGNPGGGAGETPVNVFPVGLETKLGAFSQRAMFVRVGENVLR